MSKTIETASCHIGTSKGIRATITILDVKGIIEHHVAITLSGLDIAPIATINAKMIGIVIGVVNCWVSVSLLAAAPTAANIEA